MRCMTDSATSADLCTPLRTQTSTAFYDTKTLLHDRNDFVCHGGACQARLCIVSQMQSVRGPGSPAGPRLREARELGRQMPLRVVHVRRGVLARPRRVVQLRKRRAVAAKSARAQHACAFHALADTHVRACAVIQRRISGETNVAPFGAAHGCMPGCDSSRQGCLSYVTCIGSVWLLMRSASGTQRFA